MNVAILGFGKEGKASYNYWLKQGSSITIFDQNKIPASKLPKGCSAINVKDSFNNIKGFDLVIRTASLNPNKISTEDKIWSATNEFFSKCPAPVIGVTGTKGKGTTSSLIAHILKTAGKRVHLVGNIGVPALTVLPKISKNDIVVFELSSFQLWDLEFSPNVAVILMIEPDHLDIHGSMQNYIQAKSNITTHQTAQDLLIHHPTNKSSILASSFTKATKVAYLTKQGAYVKDDFILIDNKKVFSVSYIQLIGSHNLENVTAAITAAWQYTKDVESIQKALQTFKGLPYRLELIHKYNNVSIYNDSFASNPSSTTVAIKSFPNNKIILICGGFDRGISHKKLTKIISEQKNIKSILLIGQVKDSLRKDLLIHGVEINQVMIFSNLEECLKRALSLAEDNDVILFSPGFPSFDMFKDFTDRGQTFTKLVKQFTQTP
ncbi:MAG: UDP-N-acetylmuramoylalanine--D-glutamate ligase [Patescibacteria group bacterium]|nr:UDP-N-acetylmuramoylalanine--D-glutamate ligase [Patescibacteria group bacterium]